MKKARATGAGTPKDPPKSDLNECCLRAINRPEVLDFFEAVKVEVAHQRERWKKSDPLKGDDDWYWLIGWLGGKVLTDPYEAGDTRTKAERMLHRIVTVAAAACHWHGSVKERVEREKKSRRYSCSLCKESHGENEGCPRCRRCRALGGRCSVVHMDPLVLDEILKRPKKVEVEGGGDPEVLIPAFSEKVFEEIGPLAVVLVDDIRKKYGGKVASNVLTNAMIAATAWQFGNQIGQIGTWESDQERQDYCTKIATKLHELLEKERPAAT